jgi:hypothetical protein
MWAESAWCVCGRERVRRDFLLCVTLPLFISFLIVLSLLLYSTPLVVVCNLFSFSFHSLPMFEEETRDIGTLPPPTRRKNRKGSW